ncbi:hypothetical protein RND81_12G239000 [Saponaria officinalis]|uniref:Cytochrome P450 n=1 Tax=Saponaria officinalis TaxID=3572 RepID=A0AAW1HET7_SAPOF
MDASACMSIAISLICILVVTFSWNIFKWLWLNPKKLEKILKNQGFQGNNYKLFYGDSIEKAQMRNQTLSKPMSHFTNDYISRSHSFYHHIVKNYGAKSFTWNGPIPVVNLSEARRMKEVLMKMNEFPKPKPSPLLKLLVTGLFDVEGHAWSQRRRLLNPAFHLEKLKLMIPAFTESMNDLINKWEKMTSTTGSCELDVGSDLYKLSADAISRVAFGSSYEEGEKIFDLLNEQLLLVQPLAASIYIPGWRFIPTKQNRRIMEIQNEIKYIIKTIINKRKNAIQGGEKPKDDLLGILLESNKQDNNSMTLEEIINECKIFYLAGQETTSTLLIWTLIMLSKHQHWQKFARDEVLNTFGSNNTPHYQGLNQLNIVTMILNEVLRLYPPVSELTRRVSKDIKVGDTILPSGVEVYLPILHIHQDEKYWGDDAKEFNPNRFIEGIFKATKGNMCFFPFGGGPRICLGLNFAMIEVKLALVLILQRFSFELSPSYAHAPAAIVTTLFNYYHLNEMMMDASTSVTFSWSIFKWVWLNPKKLEKFLRNQGFQGNNYKLLYGDSIEKAQMQNEALSKPMSHVSNDYISRSHSFYHHIVKTYGTKSFIWKGPIPVVNIWEAGIMKEVLMKMNEFPKPNTNPLLKLLATGLVGVEGQVWSQRRKLLNPAFHLEKLKLMLPAFSESVNDLINKWEEMTSKTSSCELDVCSDLHKLSADTISKVAFGSSFEEGGKIFDLLSEQLLLVLPLADSMYMPGWRFLPTKQNRRIMQIQKEIIYIIKNIIKKRKNAIQGGEKPKDDLLGILLESNEKDNNSMSLEEVVDECKVFYLAGQETTSILLTWTLILLGKHQHWQKLARDEVLNTFGSNKTPHFQDLNRLNIVTMILNEVLRLYPPVTELLRRVSKDIKVGDTILPSGVEIYLPILDIHQDGKYWGDDAKEFNPNRFNEGISKATNGNMCFFPFGGGPRICIGLNFAMVEAKLALVLILQRFSFELSPSYVHAPAVISITRPQFGAQLNIKWLHG